MEWNKNLLGKEKLIKCKLGGMLHKPALERNRAGSCTSNFDYRELNVKHISSPAHPSSHHVIVLQASEYRLFSWSQCLSPFLKLPSRKSIHVLKQTREEINEWTFNLLRKACLCQWKSQSCLWQFGIKGSSVNCLLRDREHPQPPHPHLPLSASKWIASCPLTIPSAEGASL